MEKQVNTPAKRKNIPNPSLNWRLRLIIVSVVSTGGGGAAAFFFVFFFVVVAGIRAIEIQSYVLAELYLIESFTMRPLSAYPERDLASFKVVKLCWLS